MTVVLEEFAEAAVDSDWLARAVALIDREPADAAEAACRLRVLRRAEHALAAARITATADLADRCEAEGTAFADLEVAVALGVGPGAGITHTYRAREITAHLPVTLAAMADGRVSEYHAINLLDLAATARTDTDPDAGLTLLGACERLIWSSLPPDPLVGQLRARARRVMLTRHPAAFTRRHEQARRHADVRLRAEELTGMGWLSAYLPLVDATTLMAALDTQVKTAHATGDPRSAGQIRTDTLLSWAETTLTASHPDQNGNGPRSHRRPVEIHVAVTLPALLGLTDTPGEIPDTGPIPAQAIRQLARQAATRLLITDPDTGRLLDYGRSVYRPPAPLAAAVKATYPTSVAPGSTTPASRCDLDHTQPFNTGGPTALTNLVPLNRRHHRAKTHGGWTYTLNPDGQITWTTALRQTATTQPFDYRLGEATDP